jgi:protein O-GlcNAc transferase
VRRNSIRYLVLCPLLTVAMLGQSVDVLVRKAREDLQAGRNSQAEEELARAINSQPANWSLWCDLGSARITLGESETAIHAFERARKLAPREASPYFGLGLAYMRRGESRNALRAYGDGLARNPNDAAGNQNYALLLIQKGDFRDAVAPLKKLKSQQPDNIAARVTLIEAYLKAGLKDEGEDEITQLLSIHIASMQEELSLANLLLADRQGAAAVNVLRHAALTWPEAAKPHGLLGLLMNQTGQHETAVAELGRAVQLDSDSAEYALGLGEALLRWRHDPVALQFLLAIQSKFGTLPLYKFELGLAYFYLTRYPLAQQEFENLARERPDSSRVQYLLGGTYQAMGKLDKAEECYRKAIALKPDEGSYYITLASLRKKVNPADLSEAVRLVQKALVLSPEDQEAKLLLASCFLAQGELADAQALLDAVITRNPDSRAAHVALARVYLRQKRVKDAEQEEAIAAKLETNEQNEVSPWGPGGIERP